MTFSEIWEELERVGTGGGEGRFKRRIHPEATLDLFLAVAKPTNRRMLLMLVSDASIDGVDELPTSQGVEARVARPGDDGRDAAVELVLIDPRYSDIFGALVADIASAVVVEREEAAAVGVFAGRLRRWQRFLEEGGLKGLSPEKQRGLFAELWLLREHLLPTLGAAAAVSGWTGPSHASHDFQLGARAVEVKATATKQHQVLRIASERQLDDTGVDELFLFHLSLDAHLKAGENLVMLVEDVRARLRTSAVASVFEERLFEVGYLDSHATLYRDPGYTVREGNFFRVEEGFPRIVERDLHVGVGDIRYSVAVSECKHFSVEAALVQEALRSELGSP